MSLIYDKDTKRYRIRIFRGGRYVVNRRLPAGITKAQAEARHAKYVAEAFACGELGKKPERSISEAVNKWREEECCKSKNPSGLWNHAAKMTAFFVGKPLLAMPDAISEYVRSNRGVLADGTLNRRVAIMRRIANLAYKQWGWLDQPIAHKIRLLPVNNARQVFLTKEEIHRIADACEREQTKAMVLVAAWTGLRRGELMSLNTHGRHAVVHAKDSKNGRPRIVPLVGPAIDAINLFPLTYNVRTLTRDFDQARVKAGLPHARFHDLRHSCASLLLNAGVSLEIIGQILGHKDVRTTRRYAHLSLEAATEALRRIA